MQPKTIAIVMFVVIVLPLWLFAAWASGLIHIGEEKPLDRETPVLIEETQRSADRLSNCLWKNHSGWLSLTHAGAPYRPANTRRLRHRASHLVVDIVPRGGGGSELRVYKLNNAALARRHLIAIQTCIPEYGLPAAGDPRNDAFYRALLNNSAIEDAP